jgi:hypothetical protein
LQYLPLEFMAESRSAPMQQYPPVSFADAEDVAHVRAGESFDIVQRYHPALTGRQVLDEPPDACGQVGCGDAFDGFVGPVSR